MSLTALHHFGPEDLNPDEVIIYEARLNIIAFLLSCWLGFLMVGVGFVILGASYMYRTTIGFLIDPTITLGFSLLIALFVLPGLYHLYLHLLDRLYDEGVITNQRVIDYNQKSLFADEMVTVNMRSIDSMTVEQDGILRSFFNYGILRVETAEQDVILVDISKPKQVQRLVDEISNRVKKEVAVDAGEVLKVCGLG